MKAHSPDFIWRKFAPAGHENDLSELAAAYRWQAKVDKACRTAARMTRARIGIATTRALVAFLQKTTVRKAKAKMERAKRNAWDGNVNWD